jgi:hypothetical protein
VALLQNNLTVAATTKRLISEKVNYYLHSLYLSFPPFTSQQHMILNYSLVPGTAEKLTSLLMMGVCKLV